MDQLIGGAWLAIIAGALIVVSTLLPWMTGSSVFATLNRNAFQMGTRGSTTWHGPVLLILGIVTVLIGITRLLRAAMPRYLQRSSIVTGVVAGVVVVTALVGVHQWAQQITTGNVTAAIGYGAWIALVGSGTAVAAGFALRHARRSEAVPGALSAPMES